VTHLEEVGHALLGVVLPLIHAVGDALLLQHVAHNAQQVGQLSTADDRTGVSPLPSGTGFDSAVKPAASLVESSIQGLSSAV
jgi:hypothetical protein